MMGKSVGDKFERLTIIEDLGMRADFNGPHKRRWFLCKCDCGNTREIRSDDIGRRAKDCGCAYKKHLEQKSNKIKIRDKFSRLECLQAENRERPIAPGTVFGRLTVLEYYGKDMKNGKNCGILYRCKCECGNETFTHGHNLRNGGVQSCGCLKRELNFVTVEHARKILTEKYLVEGTNIAKISSKTIPSNNTSGVRGVSWYKSWGRWVATIIFKGKKYYLGSFKNLDDAAKARKNAEEKVYGEFLEWYYNSRKE